MNTLEDRIAEANKQFDDIIRVEDFTYFLKYEIKRSKEQIKKIDTLLIELEK